MHQHISDRLWSRIWHSVAGSMRGSVSQSILGWILVVGSVALCTNSPCAVHAEAKSEPGCQAETAYASSLPEPLKTKQRLCEKAMIGVLQQVPWEKEKCYESLIASLPNPYRTGAASLFEPALEGVIAALSDYQYVRDRSWLWTIETKKDDDAGGTTESAKSKPEAKPKPVTEDDCSSLVPGVIVFRRESQRDMAGADPTSEPARIVVFVVGESPVWGVDREPVHWAVSKRRDPIDADGRRPPLRVIGPYFSGSATSLSAALSAATTEEIRMASGTMTAKCPRKSLARFVAAFAVDHSDARRDTLAEFVDPLPGKNPLPVDACAASAAGTGDVEVHDNLALLREDGTAFGSLMRTSSHPWYDIPLSASVSRVRHAYAKLEVKRDAERGARTPPWLDAPLDDDPSGPDLLATLSRTSVIANDLKFAQIVDELRANGITNVGIHLHAAADVIFVTQHLRRAMPEVRPLLLSMDRALLSPEYEAAMDGALVASAYLMLKTSRGDFEAEPWNDKMPLRAAWTRPFSRDSGPGIYWATNWLLYEKYKKLRCQTPSAGAETCQVLNQAGLGSVERPAELGVIRRGKVWPLRSSPAEPRVSGGQADSVAASVSPFELLLTWLITLGAFCVELIPSWRARTKHGSEKPDAGQAFLSGSHVLAVSAFATCTVLLLPWRSAQGASLVLSSGYLGFQVLGPRGRAAKLSPLELCKRYPWSLALMACSLLVAYCFINADQFTLNRAVAISSGVSPLTPILLWWASVAVYLKLKPVDDVTFVPPNTVLRSLLAIGVIVPVISLCKMFGFTLVRGHALTLEDASLNGVLFIGLLVSYTLVLLTVTELFLARMGWVSDVVNRDAPEIAIDRAARRINYAAANVVCTSLFFMAYVNEYAFHPGRVLRSAAAIVLALAITSVCYCYWRVTVEQAKIAPHGAPKEESATSTSRLKPFWHILAFAAIPMLIAINAYFPDLSYAIRDLLAWRNTFPPVP